MSFSKWHSDDIETPVLEEVQPVKSDKSPSICRWSLEFSFDTKEQATKAIELLNKDETDFTYTLEAAKTKDKTVYIITIPFGLWASNLAAVADILKQVDFKG